MVGVKGFSHLGTINKANCILLLFNVNQPQSITYNNRKAEMKGIFELLNIYNKVNLM